MTEPTPSTSDDALAATAAFPLSPALMSAMGKGTFEAPGFVYTPGYSLDLALRSVGEGWAGIITELFAKLAELPRVKVDQVKEKYGTLRVYHETGLLPEEVAQREALLLRLEADGIDPESDAYGEALDAFEATYGVDLRRQDDAAYALIEEAERRSAQTCETCGAPGQVREGSWYRTACDAHSGGNPTQRADGGQGDESPAAPPLV